MKTESTIIEKVIETPDWFTWHTENMQEYGIDLLFEDIRILYDAVDIDDEMIKTGLVLGRLLGQLEAIKLKDVELNKNDEFEKCLKTLTGFTYKLITNLLYLHKNCPELKLNPERNLRVLTLIEFLVYVNNHNNNN